MYILSERAVKAIHEHRMAQAIQHRENARLRRRRRRRPFLASTRARSPQPAGLIASTADRST